MTKPFIEEFLYRGRDPEGDMEPAWHLVLGVANTDPLGKKTIAVTAPMTVDQAKAAGWDLAEVVQAINADALAHADALAAKLKDTEQERATAAKERAEAIEAALNLEASLAAVIAERDDAHEKLATNIAASGFRESQHQPSADEKDAAKQAALASVRRKVSTPSVRLPDHLRH